MLVINEICSQGAQGRNAGDILSLYGVFEKKYHIKNVEKKVMSKFGQTVIKFDNWHIRATRKYHPHIF